MYQLNKKKTIMLDFLYEGEVAHWIDDLPYNTEVYYSVDVEIDVQSGEVEVLEVVAMYTNQHGNELGTEIWTLQDLLELHPESEDLIKSECSRLYGQI